MSGPTQHIPFNYEGSKAVFGVKVAVFLLSGFSIPFAASYYQMYVQNILCHVGLTVVTFSVGKLLEAHRYAKAGLVDLAFA
jgi:hypothetical protein